MSVRFHLRAALLAPGLFIAFASQAQTHLAPGLWEQQVTMKSDNPQMEAGMAKMKEQMAAMSPEQRAMMEKMMAGKGVGVGPSGNAIRMCVTKEQSERDVPPQHDGRCSQQDVTHSGNTVKYNFSCQGGAPGQAVTGHGEFTVDSSKSFTGHSVTVTTIQGKPTQMQADIVGKWIGSDCGDVKPVQVPAR
jgi:hypothetical protein